MDRIKLMLEKGYFPIQLPPCFRTDKFSEKYKKVVKGWPNTGNVKSRPEKYSVARSSYYRRITEIVNPVGFYYLAKVIDNNWEDISEHYGRSEISLSRPVFEESLRSIKISKFSDLYEARVKKSAGYRFALITDITSFFPTVYTHTIPWALHTKSVAKEKRRPKDLFGNAIDAACMSIQDSQTIGLPIGPDTSHIIAEILASSVDKKLHDDLGYWPEGFRYVDDYCLFFNKREDAEKCLAILTKAVSDYELHINPSKTKIVEVHDLTEESWKYNLKKLEISSARREQKDDIHNFFETLFAAEKRFKDESLVKYGLKQISTKIIKKTNWPVFEAYVLKCGYGFPNTLQVIANILLTYHHHDYELNIKAVKRFCENLISVHAIADHHNEVSWLLWICKELKLDIGKSAIKEIESMSSSICLLMLLDLCKSNVFSYQVPRSRLQPYSQKEALYDDGWLLSYEAGKRKWLGNKSLRHIDSDEKFRCFLNESVSFYDEYKSSVPIFSVKENSFHGQEDIFDNDDEVRDFFEFDEVDEEYFDSSETDEDEEDEFKEIHELDF